ncbi:MAG: hypothetical protein K6E56_06060 [Lachnospiraceae bacterium]|nr:hypothetical protein [Lachnospiraceae bacterium]
MAISIGSGNNLNSYEFTSQLAAISKDKESADAVSSRVKNLNSETDKEEAVKAIKEFESYFVEQFLKKVEEEFIDEDNSTQKLTSYFMDSVNKELAGKLIETTGQRLTETLYEQMCRNYNLNIKDAAQNVQNTENAEPAEASGESIAASGES